mmetsp:Transcript_9560/g.27526  ORF Transcript_9560/g.27526 Transcript_9560/m.27526 type:complete len:309 (+) Transcript_9560:1413-2339(+)
MLPEDFKRQVQNLHTERIFRNPIPKLAKKQESSLVANTAALGLLHLFNHRCSTRSFLRLVRIFSHCCSRGSSLLRTGRCHSLHGQVAVWNERRNLLHADEYKFFDHPKKVRESVKLLRSNRLPESSLHVPIVPPQGPGRIVGLHGIVHPLKKFLHNRRGVRRVLGCITGSGCTLGRVCGSVLRRRQRPKRRVVSDQLNCPLYVPGCLFKGLGQLRCGGATRDLCPKATNLCKSKFLVRALACIASFRRVILGNVVPIMIDALALPFGVEISGKLQNVSLENVQGIAIGHILKKVNIGKLACCVASLKQ